MKKQITIQLTVFLFYLMFSCLIESSSQNLKALVNSRQSGTTIEPEIFFDYTELRKYRFDPTSKILYSINDENEVVCLSNNWKDCLSGFKSEEDATGNILSPFTTDEITSFKRENRVLQCRDNEHTQKFSGTGYYSKDHWCNRSRNVYYDKWLCNDFTKLNIAMWIDFKTKRSLCASTDGVVCATYNRDQCNALTNSATVLKIDMGYNNSITKNSPITISGKIFIYSDTFTLPLKQLATIAYTNSSQNYLDAVTPTELINLGNFVAPRDFQFMKFYVTAPTIGFRQYHGSYYAKIKVKLMLDNIVLSVKEIIQPNDMRKRSLTFSGVTPSVKKGPHSLILEVITWAPSSWWAVISEGRYRVGLEGY
jgi:hypothetical protein